MKVYCVHSRQFDFRQDYYRPLAALARETGHSFVFPYGNPDEIPGIVAPFLP